MAPGIRAWDALPPVPHLGCDVLRPLRGAGQVGAPPKRSAITPQPRSSGGPSGPMRPMTTTTSSPGAEAHTHDHSRETSRR